MKRYQWTALSKQQVGAFGEYFVKMEMTMHGFHVFTPEVDDRGIDFVCRHGAGPFIEVQVKSVRKLGGVILSKSKFYLSEYLYLALGMMLADGNEPQLFLIPSLAWQNLNSMFVGNDYGKGKSSPPEWRLNLSARNMPLLEPYRFNKTIEGLLAAKEG